MLLIFYKEKKMKNGKLMIVCFALFAVFVLVGCGGAKDTPQSLAKQYFDLSMQITFDEESNAEIRVQMDAIKEKVDAMPLGKQLSYQGELLKLQMEAMEEAFSGSDTDELKEFLQSGKDAVNELGIDTSDFEKSLGELESNLQDAANEIGEALGNLFKF